MAPVKSWVIWYADGSTAAWNCPADGSGGVPGCDEHTVHVNSWAEAPPFGVQAIVYYNVDGTKLINAEQHDDSVYEIREGIEAGGQPAKFGLWTDNESYWMVYNAYRGMVKP